MIRNAAGSKLAAIRPDGTTAVTAFTASLPVEITAIFVTNTSGSGVTFRLFHAGEGEAFDLDSALYYDVAVAANTTLLIQSNAPNGLLSMEDNDIIGVRASAADVINFTLYGVTADVARQLPGR